MLTLIEHGDVYTPRPIGRQPVLVAGGHVVHVGPIDGRALALSGLELDVIDAAGCVVVPGLIDPHQHLIGGSGETGFSTASPEIFAGELALSGITTVVGCLGTDNTTKTLPGLVAKARGLREVGFTTFIYTGGYSVPPATMLGSVREDILLVDIVIGVGEIAIADQRSTQPEARELARIAVDAAVAGRLSRKAGVVHFHVGDRPSRLAAVRQLLDEFEVDGSRLYPTHCNRSEAILAEAIELAARGLFVDIDTTERRLPYWLRCYRDGGGDFAQLTVSTDADSATPLTLWSQLQDAVAEGWRLEQLLPLVTANTARVLRLAGRGELAAGGPADLVIARRQSLELRDVMAGGRWLARDGHEVVKDGFLAQSSRRIQLNGEEAHATPPVAVQ